MMRPFPVLLLIFTLLLPAGAEDSFQALAGTYEKFNHSSVTLLPQVISFGQFKGNATEEICFISGVKVIGKKFVIECRAGTKAEIEKAAIALEEKGAPWSKQKESMITGTLEMVAFESNTHIYFKGRRHVYAK